MKHIIASYKKTDTPVLGVCSWTTPDIHGELKVVRCKFTTATTTFILTISDSDGMVIYLSETETGALAEQVDIPVRGEYTAAISAASVNEAFTIKLEVVE